MNEFLTKERAKFEQWFAIYGDSDACKEAQWRGFRGRAHLARKGQNNPTQEKEYRVTYLDKTGEQKYHRLMSISPKEACRLLENKESGAVALYAKRPTIYGKTTHEDRS